MNNRLPLSLFTTASAFLAFALAPTLHAQVSTNLGALPSRPTQSVHTSHKQASAQTHVMPHEAAPAEPHTPSGYTTALNIAQQAPNPIVLPPPFQPIPTHAPVQPAEIVPVQDANSQILDQKDHGLRVQFSGDRTDMNEVTINAIHHFGERTAQHPEQRLILHSFAILPGDDRSMPRRIALKRALAVRSLLIRSGVATTRIYPIAQGRPDITDHAPANRLDITVETNPSDSPPPTLVAAPDTISSDQKGTSAP